MINENESKIEFLYTMIQNDFRKANCLFFWYEKSDLGLGPDTREKPDPGPWGKNGPIFSSVKTGLWALIKHRTPDLRGKTGS